MSEQQDNDQDLENVHSVANPAACVEMSKQYNWKLKRIVRTRDSLLPIDCVFVGEQTSFEDTRYGD